MEAKERIMVKASELFMQYGIRSVSMDDIANNLGMSKKTLYQYYADKDELVHAVFDAHITRMQGDCVSCANNAKGAVHELFLTLEEIMEEFSNMNPMLLHDLQKFHFRTYEVFMQYKNKFLTEMVRQNIERGIAEELYRPDLNIDVLTKFRLESMMLPFDVNLFPPGKYGLGETTGIIMELFIYGLVTQKGHKLIQKYNEARSKKLLSN
ncbi:MAG: TetR/AcrR family transcriptional regulator [Chitinophagaceae bacterium]|nr:MAG: TetR/AcrR family transcriptional regulator [Chitinophagaceae bacterium]